MMQTQNSQGEGMLTASYVLHASMLSPGHNTLQALSCIHQFGIPANFRIYYGSFITYACLIKSLSTRLSPAFLLSLEVGEYSMGVNIPTNHSLVFLVTLTHPGAI